MADAVERDRAAGGAARAPRVLVVEDSGIIAAKLVRMLRANGCEAVGPAATLAAALDLAARRGGALDAALLDIDLRGEAVYPLAAALRARGVPVLFLTGYEAAAIPEAWRATPRVEKPFEEAVLLRALGRVLAAPASAPDAAPDGTAPSGAAPDDGSHAPLSGLDHRLFAALKTSRDLSMERRILTEKTASARPSPPPPRR